MTGALADSIGPALGTWPEPLERRSLVGVDLLDEEIVSDEIVVVLGVREGGVEEPLQVARDAPWTVAQHGTCVRDRLPANVFEHEARLTRGGSDVLGTRGHDRPGRRRRALGALG